MAAPSYTEDLTDITLAETVTNWSALGGGAAGLSADPDFCIEGTNAVTKQVTGAHKGMMFDFGSTISLGADDHIFVWLFCTTPGLLDTLQNYGMTVAAGTTTSAYNEFHVKGAAEYILGGWICFPIRYVTTGNASPPYRTLTGSPGAKAQLFGGLLSTTDTVKAVNFGIDAIRYGTGIYITAGDAGSPATFTGAATANDGSTARWGILAAQPGGFALQGRFVIGQNNSKVATAAYFVDSNALVTITDTPHSLTDFTQVIIDHASTTFNLTNITFLSLGTNNPGKFVYNNATTTSALTGCVFGNIGITTLRVGVTANSCTWRKAAQVTQNGATLDGCIIEENSAAVAIFADDPAKISDCTFTSDGTGHAIEMRPTGAGPFNINYSGNQDSAYAASNGSTGNETILIHPVTNSASVTLNIIGGGSTPSIMEHADYTGTFTLVVSPVTTKITVKNVTDLGNIQNVRVLLHPSDNTGPMNYQESVTITRASSTATVTHSSHGLATNDLVLIEDANQDEYNGVYQITVVDVNTYTYTVSGTPASPATGTITSTAVIFNKLTDVNGEVSDTRAFASNQPITGRARKSSSAPLYKTQSITGTISSTDGLTTTLLLIPDG